MLDFMADVLLQRSLHQLVRDIRARQPLYLSGTYADGTRFRLHIIDDDPVQARWRTCLLVVAADGVHVYPKTRQMEIHHHFSADALRWFGRPKKYEPGSNLMWLYFEIDEQWRWLQLNLQRGTMQRFVRAMKQIATEAQITAYRRRRPYIHFGPTEACRATQDLQGAWTLGVQPVTLHLGPSALIILQDGHVQRVLALEQVQNIEVMRRMDDPTGDGVVRFKFTSSDTAETLAFALPEYVQFGADLGEAAKRTLEDPPVFYGKKKGKPKDRED